MKAATFPSVRSLAPVLVVLLATLALFGCATPGPNAGWKPSVSPGAASPHYPDITFAVLSDTHYYDPSLGTSGAAWTAYMAEDRKLLADSAETLRVAVDGLLHERPRFVLVSGDLTKDGERQCHQMFADALRAFESQGIPVYVVPGNHDIDNPDAARFLPSGGKERIPSVSPADFARIYSDFGYADAVSRDPESLSYVAEPVPGLWLLALDSAKYESNAKRGFPETSGAIRPATLTWMEHQLKESIRLGKTVIAMEHHPLMEHFDGMKDKYPEYIVDDNWRVASMLAAYGVSLFFSGHFHANSVVMHRWDDSAPPGLRGTHIVDVETGSLVTWPCAYRTVTLSADGSVAIRTSRVDQLPSYSAAGRSFDDEGKKTIEDGIGSIAATAMKHYWVPQKDIDTLTPQIVAALMAHYAGDAIAPKGAELITHSGLSFMGGFVVSSYDTFIKGIWKTHPPANVELMPDNNLTISAEGTW